MKKRKEAFLGVLVAGLLILSPSVFWETGPTREPGSAIAAVPSSVRTAAPLPPIAQPLVPEGAFAVELANGLMLGQPQTAAEAESLLSSAGIEPKNGWIDDYPMTPDIIGEIEKSVAEAAAAQRIGLSRDQAQRTVKNLEDQFGLRVTPAASTASTGGFGNSTIYKYKDKAGILHFTDRYESIPPEYRDQIEMIRGEARSQPSMGLVSNGNEPQVNADETETEMENTASNPPYPVPEVINNYYYHDGPPVVTYYPPPNPYLYMYTWVPYPFWCSRVFFPGFFVLHDFHRTVYFHKRPFVLTNHVVHVRTHTVYRIDPVQRPKGGSAAMSPVTSQKFLNTPHAQTGAQAIVALSRQRGGSGKIAPVPGTGKNPPSTPMVKVSQKVRQNPGAVNSQKMIPSTVNQGANLYPGGTRFSTADGKTRIQPSTSEKKSGTKGPGDPNGANPIHRPNQVAGGPFPPQPLNGQNRGEVKNPPAAGLPKVTPPLMDSPNRGRPTPSVDPRSPQVEHKEFVGPSTVASRNETGLTQLRASERPTFSPPTSTPQTGVFSQPSFSPGRVLSPPSPIGGGSFGGARGGRW